MQRTVPRTTGDLDRLVAELDGHWGRLGRFVMSRKVRSRLHAGVAAELSPVQAQAIAELEERPLRIGELASRLGLAESTVTRLVDRLESLDLVNRRVDRSDRRSVDAQLTAPGRRVAATVARTRRALLTDILEGLGPREREELVRLFGKVTAALAEKEERMLKAGRAR